MGTNNLILRLANNMKWVYKTANTYYSRCVLASVVDPDVLGLLDTYPSLFVRIWIRIRSSIIQQT
jgi:hypothetical protein